MLNALIIKASSLCASFDIRLAVVVVCTDRGRTERLTERLTHHHRQCLIISRAREHNKHLARQSL